MVHLTTEALRAGIRAAIEIQNGTLPTPAQLEAAPVLSHWVLSEELSGLHRLIGMVSGHPVLDPGWCTTSIVLVMDPQHHWARTVSRLYRLNAPLRVETPDTTK